MEALRAAGHDAHYAYVGGYKLQAKIGHHDFAHPIIQKAQNPVSFVRSVQAIDHLLHRHGFDVVHAHLTYDHWLARLAVRDHNVILARTFHARRVLRNDPFSRSLLRATQKVFVVNESFLSDDAVFTPPPIDFRQFSPSGPRAFDSAETIVTVIGKLSKGRGFETALETFAALRRITPCRLMIIGHGEHRSALEQYASDLGIAEHVLWAGYHEDDLAEHYRASDVLLFTARGSDEGHRAILEAMACGVPVATVPLEGVHALVPAAWIASSSSPEALAQTAASLFGQRVSPELVKPFGYEAAAERLLRHYA